MVVLVLIFIVGCSSESSMPLGANLNRYSYVAMPPLADSKETGTATRTGTIALKDYLSKLFRREGLTVLPDYGSSDTLAPKERLKVLNLDFGYSFDISQSSIYLSLSDTTGQIVFSSSGKGFGGYTDACLSGAIELAFAEFRKNYSAFDPNLASAYAKELKEKLKKWENIDVNEVTLRDYLDENIGTLDSIEGLWILDRTGWPHAKIGIIRDKNTPTRDFIGIKIEYTNAIWEPGHVFVEFQKTASSGTYITTLHNLDGSKLILNSIVGNTGSLVFHFINTDTGDSTPFTFLKIYPQNINITSETETTPSQVVSQGTGFAVSSKGHIITAQHVIKGAKTLKIYLSKDSFVYAQLLHSDPMNDLAVLKIENTIPDFLQIAPMRSVKTGDRVFTLGFPVSSILGQEAKYTEGVVSSLSGLKGASSFLQITVPVQPGNSGGALVNERGEVVGIITSSAAILPFIEQSGTLPQNVNWAVKADYLRPLIELPKGEQKKLSREQIIEHVKKSTFFIETE